MNKPIITIIIILIIVVGGVVVLTANRTSEQKAKNQFVDQITKQKELAPGPKIEVSPNSHDFGTVIYGDVPEYNFTITNIGDEPLKILRLSTSCGCAEAQVAEENRIITPGESVPMVVTFNPAVHKDNSDLGAVTRVVYIKSNDPTSPEVEVAINAFVIKEESNNQGKQVKTIRMVARQWEFGPNIIRVKQGDKVKLEIKSIDVAHSFTLPDFNINQRLEPGKTTVVEFVADKKGVFDFRCAVFCGAGHSGMKGQLIVE